ncbi:hypothetical protein ABPG74_003967 [Tetrahymena malaccensis]
MIDKNDSEYKKQPINKKWKTINNDKQFKDKESNRNDIKNKSLQNLSQYITDNNEYQQNINHIAEGDANSQKKSSEDINSFTQNTNNFQYSRQNAKRKASSIFNEHELKRAPTLFDNANDLQRQLEFQIQSSCQTEQINENKLLQFTSTFNKDQGTEDKQFINSNQQSLNLQKTLFPQATTSKMYILNAKRYLYLMFQDPSNTKVGKYLHLFLQLFIIVSITQIISDSCYYDESRQTSYNDVSSDLDYIIFLIFLIELCIRLFVHNAFGESYVSFFKNTMNIIDILSLIPYIIDFIIVTASAYYNYKVGFLRVIRIIRLVRIVRIFKLSRYLKGLSTLKKSLNVSKKYFPFICATLTIFVLFISVIIYYFEQGVTLTQEQFKQLGEDSNTQITSILQSIWFVLTTLTTLGYGDKIPYSVASKIVVGFVVLVSQSFVIGLPIAIVGFDFSNVYNEEKEQQKYNKYKDEETQDQQEKDQKLKELQFMQKRLKNISKTNKLVREMSSRSSKMCYLITKDLVGLYFQVVLNEQREIQKRMDNLNMSDGKQNWKQLQKFFGISKIKMENIKVKKSIRSPTKKDRIFSSSSTLNKLQTQNSNEENIDDNQDKNANEEQEQEDAGNENLENKIKNKFVRNNLKKLKTLLVSNPNIEFSHRKSTRILQPNETHINSNYQTFHPKGFLNKLRTQKSEEISDFNFYQKQQQTVQNIEEQNQNPSKIQKSYGINLQQKNSDAKRIIQNKNDFQMVNQLNDQAQKPKGDDIENLPDLQNQLEFLNEILMDLVSEESVILDEKQHQIDEYNETCAEAEVDDENMQLFEIEKIDRTNKRQQKILFDTLSQKNNKDNKLDQKISIPIQRAKSHVRSKTVIQEVTESNNDSSEFNWRGGKDILNISLNSKSNSSYRVDLVDEEHARQIKTPLSGSRLLIGEQKSKDLQNSIDIDQMFMDSSQRLKNILNENKNQQSAKFRCYKSQNQILRNQSFENLSDRKKTQIKHESYQNLFENRFSPGQRMTIINKKKPQGLTRAKTMFVKNVNISKNCIQECSSDEEDELNNSDIQTSKQNKNQARDDQRSIPNNHFNKKYFKSNSFNNIPQTKNYKIDQSCSQNNYGEQESEQRSNLRQSKPISPYIDDSLKLDDIQLSGVLTKEKKSDELYSAIKKQYEQQNCSNENKSEQINNKKNDFDQNFQYFENQNLKNEQNLNFTQKSLVGIHNKNNQKQSIQSDQIFTSGDEHSTNKNSVFAESDELDDNNFKSQNFKYDFENNILVRQLSKQQSNKQIINKKISQEK